tara:strand:- start:8 stop:187 length:180 start_codon:yes stop_codon:yes gene_type:complete
MIEPFLLHLGGEKMLGIKVWLQQVLYWGGLLWQQWFWLHYQFGSGRLSRLQSLQSKVFN